MRLKLTRSLLLVLLLPFFYIALPLFSQTPAQHETVRGKKARANEVLVRFKASASKKLAKMPADLDLSESRALAGVSRLYHFHSRSKTVTELLDRLAQLPDVEYAEPNYAVSVADDPNDARFVELWGLHNFGQSFGYGSGVAGADISALDAWQVSTGSSSTVVAIIDTGMDYTHPDLAPNVWSAPTDFTVTIGGTVLHCPAGSHGYNAIAMSCDPMDDHYHGTHVAGTIGAAGNNSMGVVGVNWTTQMIAAKFLDQSGSGYISDAVNAIEFLVQTKAHFAGSDAGNIRVVSNSWGGGGFSQAFKDEMERASDMLFVFAAGNNSMDADLTPFYPASYGSSNLISVAATDNRDSLADFSNYGKATVHLAAPGVNILSTFPDNDYTYLSGTSMATPHVSGVAALVLSRCTLDTAALRSDILDNTDPLPSLVDVTVTGGRLNAAKALRACSSVVSLTPSIMDFGTVNVGESSGVRTASLVNNQPVALTVSSVGSAVSFSESNDCAAPIAPGKSCKIGVSFTPAAAGSFSEQISIVHDGPGSPHVLTLTGKGYQPPPVEVAPSTLTFGEVVVTETSAPNTVMVTNHTAVPLPLTSVDVSGDFNASSGCGSEIAAGGSCAIAIRFAPKVPGSHSGALTLTDQAANSPQIVTLAGSAIPQMAFSPEALDFGRVGVNKSSRALPVTFSNNLTQSSIAISAIAVSGDFTQTNTCGSMVAPKSSCSISVVFKPIQAGPAQGSLTIAGPALMHSISLTGTGTGLPDLVESAVEVQSATPASGLPLTVADTTANTGTGDAAASITRFYLSPDGIKKATLIGARYLNDLGAGGTTGAVVSAFTLPLAVKGSYYLVACADDYNTVVETSETNNCTASAVFTVAAPDLVESLINVSTMNPAAGGPLQMTDTALNAGMGKAGSFSTRYYLSTDGVKKGTLIGSRSVTSLGAGESSTAAATFTVPVGLKGTMFLIGCVDDMLAVPEADETNNCRGSNAFFVAGADLVESQLAVLTSNLYAGGSMQAADVTANVGAGAAGATLTRFYLSVDGSKKGAVLASRNVQALPAGGSTDAVVTTMTIPTGSNGTYYLITCADDYGSVAEVDESNNCRASSPFSVAGADLVESQVKVLTANPYAGGGLQISDTTANVGSGGAGTTLTRFYLSVDGTKKGALLGSRSIVPLGGNSANSATTSLTLPAGLNGNYFAMVCADDYGAVQETNETNNCSASALFTIAGADLIESKVTVITTAPLSGGPLQLADTTTNVGVGAAGSSLTRYYISPDGLRKGTLIGSRTVAGLSGGASSDSGVLKFTLPAGQKGTFSVLACADDFGSVAETSEANNCTASAAFTIL